MRRPSLCTCAPLVLALGTTACRSTPAPASGPDATAAPVDAPSAPPPTAAPLVDAAAPSDAPPAVTWARTRGWTPPATIISRMSADAGVGSGGAIEGAVELTTVSGGAVALAAFEVDATHDVIVARKFDARGRGQGPYRLVAQVEGTVQTIRAHGSNGTLWVAWRATTPQGAIVQAIAMRDGMLHHGSVVPVDTIGADGSAAPGALAIMARSDGSAVALWATTYPAQVQEASETAGDDRQVIRWREMNFRAGVIDAFHRVTVTHEHPVKVTPATGEGAENPPSWGASITAVGQSTYARYWVEGDRENLVAWMLRDAPGSSISFPTYEGTLAPSAEHIGTVAERLVVVQDPRTPPTSAVYYDGPNDGTATAPTRRAPFEVPELHCNRTSAWISGRGRARLPIIGNARFDLSVFFDSVTQGSSYRPVPTEDDRWAWTGALMVRITTGGDLLATELQRFECTPEGTFAEVVAAAGDAGVSGAGASVAPTGETSAAP